MRGRTGQSYRPKTTKDRSTTDHPRHLLEKEAFALACGRVKEDSLGLLAVCLQLGDGLVGVRARPAFVDKRRLPPQSRLLRRVAERGQVVCDDEIRLERVDAERGRRRGEREREE